jgi:hypothetical protein
MEQKTETKTKFTEPPASKKREEASKQKERRITF